MILINSIRKKCELILKKHPKVILGGCEILIYRNKLIALDDYSVAAIFV